MCATSAIGIAHADTGYTAQFTTSITYQNVGSVVAQIVINYYPENSGTAITHTPANLNPGASSSVFAGSLSQLSPGFAGSAVLSSDQPIIATAVQVSTGSGTIVKNRPLSNGFAQGSPRSLIATTLKDRFGVTTRFSVQNAHTQPVDLTVKFYDASNGGALVHTATATNLPVGAAKYFDLGTISQLPSNFNGSATVDAVQTGTSTGAPIVAAALELGISSDSASSYEGVAAGATTLYMPSALCNAFGGQNTAYAIQNTDNAASAAVTITYKDLAGATVATQNATITPGAKFSSVACTAGAPAGFNGSATITSLGAPVVAIGKVYGVGLYTAFLGSTAGTNKIYSPYVRWSDSQYISGARQRAYIAIQNIGGNLNAGAVTIKFLDKNGAQVGSTVSNPSALATGQKFSTNPSAAGTSANEFGYYTDGTIGGGVLIEGPAGSQLVAVVRVTSYNSGTGGLFGEDYNGQ
jgi:hypothetical protein